MTITEELRLWLEKEPAMRDVKTGASLLLRLTRNAGIANSLRINPHKYMPLAEELLKKHLMLRLYGVTPEQAREATAKTAAVSERHRLGETLPKGGRMSTKLTEVSREHGYGKRDDHNSLPDEIQALYKENLSLLQQMRHNHTRLHILIEDAEKKGGQPDVTETYPLVKELLDADKRYRENWSKYDNYQ